MMLGERPVAARDLLVLCYHATSEVFPAALSITPRRLRAQLSFLVDRGYRGATFTEAVSSPPAGRTLVVTFDDAYRSVLTRALPILSELGLPGTVFVPTAFAGAERPLAWPGIEQWLGGPHEAELLPMSWQELRLLAGAGWEVGSHTRTHPRLTTVDDETLRMELTASKQDCESELGRPCRSVAYPYGDEDERVVRAAERAGYEAAATLPARLHAATSLRWPRVGIYHGDDGRRYQLKVSPLARRLRSSSLWRVRELAPGRARKPRPRSIN